MAHVQLDNSGTPSTPATGKTRIFVDSGDGHVKRVDDAGLVVDLEDSPAGVILADGSVPFTGDQSMGGNDLTSANLITFDAEHDNGNAGAAFGLDWNNGQKQRVTVDQNTTVTITDPPGPCNLTLKLVMGGNFTATWPAAVLWPNGTPPNLTNGGTDIVAMYFDGVSYYAVASQNFS